MTQNFRGESAVPDFTAVFFNPARGANCANALQPSVIRSKQKGQEIFSWP